MKELHILLNEDDFKILVNGGIVVKEDGYAIATIELQEIENYQLNEIMEDALENSYTAQQTLEIAEQTLERAEQTLKEALNIP